MTLVEVLIVVAILSMIAGGVAIFAIPRFMDAQRKTAETNARTLLDVADAWKANHPGRAAECPSFQDLLTEKLVRDPAMAKDPWGHSSEIVCDNGYAGVRSPGADGKAGTDDDVHVGVAGAVH